MKKILLVDDDDFIREACVDMISLMAPNEFQILTAKNGKEGLDTIQKESPFYALVTDFNMPYMNGGELVSEVIQRKISLNKIIILSGIMENETFFSKLDEENYKIIFQSKPFTPDKLIDLLRR